MHFCLLNNDDNNYTCTTIPSMNQIDNGNKQIHSHFNISVLNIHCKWNVNNFNFEFVKYGKLTCIFLNYLHLKAF